MITDADPCFKLLYLDVLSHLISPFLVYKPIKYKGK